MLDSNQRPPACEAGALPTELIDRDVGFYVVAFTASTERDDDVRYGVNEAVVAGVVVSGSHSRSQIL
jgi:hypothetical protein